MESAKIYSDEPWQVAKRFEELGSEWVHLVDLNGAFTGKPENLEQIKQIREHCNLKLELGGGIRDEETIKMYLDLGVDRLILGSVAVKDPQFVKDMAAKYPIVVGIDAIDGMVAVEGWAEVSDKVHVNEFTDMHDIGDALYNVQAENPVMDSEKIILNYQSVKQILIDIKAVGAHNQNNGREKGLTGKNKLQAMYQAYEKFYTAQGYPVTYEVLYGHAWNPKTPMQNTQSLHNEQQTSISLAQLKSTLRS